MIPLLAIALASVASAPNEPPAPPAFLAAKRSFVHCVGKAVTGPLGGNPPPILARAALARCSSERITLDQQLNTWLAQPTVSVEDRQAVRLHYADEMAALPATIVQVVDDRLVANRAPDPFRFTSPYAGNPYYQAPPLPQAPMPMTMPMHK